MQFRDRNIKSEILTQKRRELRKNKTLAEHYLWQWLRGRELVYKFRRQVSIGRYIVDFYCHKIKLVIEVDGPIHNESGIKEYDTKREDWLWQRGYFILRFLNDEVLFEGDKVLQCIKDFICILDS
jgi:very-short-patch-repair endonuclease